MINEYTEPELSLPQLLDVIERRLDSIAGITRYCETLPFIHQQRLAHRKSPPNSQTDATMLKQV